MSFSEEERVILLDEVGVLEFTKERADTEAMLRLHEEAMRLRLEALEGEVKRLGFPAFIDDEEGFEQAVADKTQVMTTQVRRSALITETRPAPCLPMLASVVNGVHPPVVKEHVRRIRVDENSALASLRAAYEKYETKEED